MRMACTYALEVWDRYVKQGEPVVYIDGVVGMRHVVDMSLPNRAIDGVDRKLFGDTFDPGPIWDAYKEPISALQDDDLDFPGEIALAYYAIYNLFGVVFERCKLYDDGETVVRQALRDEAYYEEWWTRTWDAWATRGDATYPASELDAETFAALEAGDLALAIERCRHETRLHAVLLGLAGRTDEAVAVAARVLGLDEDDWLRRNVTRIADSDAIVVGPKHYAAIFGARDIVRSVETHSLLMSGTCGFAIRRVALSGDLVVLAGDDRDDIGAYKTVLVGEELNSRDYGYRAEHLGTRTIVALGEQVALVGASDREVGVLTNRGYERLGEGRVTGAAFDEDGTHVVTYAGSAFTLWHRAKQQKLVAMDLAAEIWAAIIADGRLVLACKNERARVIDLALVR
jgi:hypothetical protein